MSNKMNNKIGYIRVSSKEQNTARQEVLMEELGVSKIFIDKVSGKNKDREQLKAMMGYIRAGDTVIVESISRFARNTRDLLELVDQLTEKDVQFISKKETIDTSTPTGQFMLTIFGAVAELERGYLLDRQAEGIEIAKRAGKYHGRKPIEVDEDLWSNLYRQWKAKEITAVKFMELVDLKPNTFYRRVKQFEEGTDIVDK